MWGEHLAKPTKSISHPRFECELWIFLLHIKTSLAVYIFIAKSVSSYLIIYVTVYHLPYQIYGSLKSYTILSQSYTGLTNIKQILPYQTQKAVEEDCETFCGQPETVIVQRWDALKTFNWETFVLTFLIMHDTHLRWEDGERANARNRGWS